MRCEACMQLLDDFIDGELRGSAHHKVEQHIGKCNNCSREAEFLRRLSRDATSLPNDIQPRKDLWPGIAAGIMAPYSKNELDASKDRDFKHKWDRLQITAWGWRVAAIAMLASLLLAGSYLVLRKYTAENEGQTLISSTSKTKPSGITASPSGHLLDNRSGAIIQDETGNLTSPNIRPISSQPPVGIVYPIDLFARVFVSNYGVYAVHQERDPVYFAVSRNFILGFDRNGTQEWIPPLPPGSTLRSVYPGGGNRLWAAYSVEEPEFQTAIAELDFGFDSQIRNVWKSDDLQISRFIIGPQGLIYAVGFRNDFSKTVAKLKKGQSITVERLHIIDPRTGEEKNLFPVTLTPKFSSQFWSGQTVLEITNLVYPAVISVKSNGNFFFTIDQTEAMESVRGLIKNEAIEHFSDGTVAARWDLGSLEPNAYLNKIFIDTDDSILAEIIRRADTGASDPLSEAVIERYLLRIDPNGRITHYDPDLYPNEVIQGWIGQTGELVTAVKEGMQQVSIRKLPF